MREALFRGKRIADDKWTYGYLFRCWGRCYLLWGMNGDNPIKEEVYPETVGQYTGLTDKNGKKIFEGDIIETSGFGYKRRTYPVVFCDGYFGYQSEYDAIAFLDSEYPIPQENREVIGNIHDNPELLEVKE